MKCLPPRKPVLSRQPQRKSLANHPEPPDRLNKQEQSHWQQTLQQSLRDTEIPDIVRQSTVSKRPRLLSENQEPSSCQRRRRFLVRLQRLCERLSACARTS